MVLVADNNVIMLLLYKFSISLLNWFVDRSPEVGRHNKVLYLTRKSRKENISVNSDQLIEGDVL